MKNYIKMLLIIVTIVVIILGIIVFLFLIDKTDNIDYSKIIYNGNDYELVSNTQATIIKLATADETVINNIINRISDENVISEDISEVNNSERINYRAYGLYFTSDIYPNLHYYINYAENDSENYYIQTTKVNYKIDNYIHDLIMKNKTIR